METTGIDLTKCNNLRYRAKVDGNNDYGRICVENADTGLAFLRSDLENDYIATWHCDAPTIDGICGRKVTDFEIVPRDPETYKDWQVGDVIRDSHGIAANGRIIFRSGEFVAADINVCICYTCEELYGIGYRLALTDIERQIIEERKPKPHEFKKGEPVLVRIFYDKTWGVGLYDAESNNVDMPYWVYVGYKKSCYSECIPLNERTMHLLGTTEDYREEQL